VAELAQLRVINLFLIQDHFEKLVFEHVFILGNFSLLGASDVFFPWATVVKFDSTNSKLREKYFSTTKENIRFQNPGVKVSMHPPSDAHAPKVILDRSWFFKQFANLGPGWFRAL